MKGAWAAAAILVIAGCAPRPGNAPADTPGAVEARREIWAEIQGLCAERELEPGFVYALVKVESDFDPRARHGEARGLMQLKPREWKAASDAPYSPGVWDWRQNLRVGTGSLAAMRRRLEASGHFSYPLLWAAYHHGFEYVEARGFDMSRIPRPSNPIAFKLYSGDTHPVETPK